MAGQFSSSTDLQLHYGNIAMWQGYSYIMAEQLCSKNSEYNYTMAVHPCNSRNTVYCHNVAAQQQKGTQGYTTALLQ